jgi:predicted restriction endonuclease
MTPEGMLSEPKGIGPASVAMQAEFGVPPRYVLDDFTEEATKRAADTFVPKNVEDGRRRIMAAIFQRLGQQTFRRKLLAAYTTQCAVTQCTSVWVLEAAHITPYRGIKTNTVSNGLLLRADIHTLFDLSLISIEPAHLKVRVSSSLANSEYALFDGHKAALPIKPSDQPSTAALEEHYSFFQP